MSDSAPEDIISWENLLYLSDFLRMSGENHISLLGGEPTLHPDFVDIVSYLIARGFNITVFTSGIMSANTLKKAKGLFLNMEQGRLNFVCNINDPELSPKNEASKVKEFLSIFGYMTIAGFNIYRTDFNMEFLFHHIKSFYMNRSIRIGLAHPIPGGKNQFISISDIDIIINRLYSYLPLMGRLRLQPSLDCGFPLCRLTDEQMGGFVKLSGSNIKFSCGPAIDIGPDMTVWNCFPLASYHKRSIFEFDSFREIVDYYKRFNNAIKSEITGLYEECDECWYREDGFCAGGCLAHALSRFKEEPRIRLPEIYQCQS